MTAVPRLRMGETVVVYGISRARTLTWRHTPYMMRCSLSQMGYTANKVEDGRMYRNEVSRRETITHPRQGLDMWE